MRKGTASNRRTEGTIERNISSKRGVKSNSLEVVGPKEVTEYICEVFDAMMRSRYQRECSIQQG
jgi:hypothetical protein